MYFNSKNILVWLLISLFYGNFLAQTNDVKSEKREFSLFGYPYLFYTPETELAAGIGGIATFYLGEEIILRPSKVILSAYYTTNKQYYINLTPEFYFIENKYFFSVSIDYSYKIDKYYGLGPSTPEISNPEYTANIFSVSLNFQLPSFLWEGYKSGFLFNYKNFRLNDAMQNPYLTGIEMSSAKSTLGVGYAWVVDTRNNIFYPTDGGYYQVKAQFFMKDIGSDFDFNIYTLDLRWYFGLNETDVVALQVYGRFARGFPPLYEYSALGGQYHMRGYFEGRYRDKNFFTTQIEYRFHMWKKFGGVIFGGFGDVSNRLKDLLILQTKFSYGFGLRYLFNEEEKVNLRADFGFGKNTSGVYFGIEEVF